MKPLHTVFSLNPWKDETKSKQLTLSTISKITRTLHESEYSLIFGNENEDPDTYERAKKVAEEKKKSNIQTRIICVIPDAEEKKPSGTTPTSYIHIRDFLERWKWKNPIQTKFGEDVRDESCGNCVATCVANYLGKCLSHIPRFETMMHPGMPYGFWWVMWQVYFRMLWKEFCLSQEHEEVLWMVGEDYYFASGDSPRCTQMGHMVMYRKWKMVFDPHPDGIGIGREKIFYYIKSPEQ